MLRPYKHEDKIILSGNDTDVSWVTWVKMTEDCFVITTMLEHEEERTVYPLVKVLNRADLVKEFELQKGSPMDYLDGIDFHLFLNQKL